MPRSLLADLGGAERAVSASLALLLGRERTRDNAHAANQRVTMYAEVALADAVHQLAAPWQLGLTHADGILGGAFPLYRLYAARDGWIAVAALESHFAERRVAELGIETPTHDALESVFARDTAAAWEAWANARDLPIAAVSDVVR
jgi:crotonobetainyl-CoA:carnitine CoA-transferase CaiB-like acyl-CoA transferase